MYLYLDHEIKWYDALPMKVALSVRHLSSIGIQCLIINTDWAFYLSYT